MRSLSLRSILRKPTFRSFSSQAPLVDVTVNDQTGIATVAMQRPPVNSLNYDLCKALLTAVEDLERNKSRGIILTSAQPTVFSAGLDILEMYKPNPEKVKLFWSTLQDLWLGFYGSKTPTAAAINGHSPAGGCMLACCCEYRVMVDQPGKNYTIGLNETKLGIVAPTWFIASFQNVVSKRVAEAALTSGKLFPVQEALTVGLIDEVVADKEEAIGKASNWLLQFTKISPTARNMTKQILRGGAIRNLQKNREADLQQFVGLVTSDSVQKNLGAYMEGLKKKQ